MDVPLQVCEERDPKGLYKLARAGKIKGIFCNQTENWKSGFWMMVLCSCTMTWCLCTWPKNGENGEKRLVSQFYKTNSGEDNRSRSLKSLGVKISSTQSLFHIVEVLHCPVSIQNNIAIWMLIPCLVHMLLKTNIWNW